MHHGQAQLRYRDAQHGELIFTGEQIRTQDDAEVGKLVSVPLKRSVDTGSVWFTVILPIGFTKHGPEDKVGFHTEGIVTTWGGPIEIPRVVGPNPTYQFVALRGTAERVIIPLAQEGGGAETAAGASS